MSLQKISCHRQDDGGVRDVLGEVGKGKRRVWLEPKYLKGYEGKGLNRSMWQIRRNRTVDLNQGTIMVRCDHRIGQRLKFTR